MLLNTTIPVSEQQHLVQLIKEVSTSVQNIFLLGSTNLQRRTRSIFHDNQPTCSYTAHYYVLVLANKEDDHSLNNLRDTIEARAQQWIPITAIVLSTQTFISWLSQGHLFASWVVKEAEELYSTGTHHLPAPSPINEQPLEASDIKLISDTKQKVSAFLAGTELYRIRKEYKLAAFMLHQAAEQQLRTLLILNTGLRINTHSIERLIRYNTMCCDKLLEVFPPHHENAKRLLNLLQKAYIGSRYNTAYTISGSDIEALTHKVNRIIEIASA